MESFANSCIPKPSSNTRHGTICKGYDESLQLPNGRQMRSNNKEKENKLTPLTRTRTATSSSITQASKTTETTSKTKTSNRGRKRKQDNNLENEDDGIDRLVSNYSDFLPDNEVVKHQAQKRKVVSLHSNSTEQQKSIDEISILKDQVKALLEAQAKKERDDKEKERVKQDEVKRLLEDTLRKNDERSAKVLADALLKKKSLEEALHTREKEENDELQKLHNEKRVLEEKLSNQKAEEVVRAQRELLYKERRAWEQEKATEEKELALLRSREEKRLLEEAIFKRDEDLKKRAVQESNEALRKQDEDDRLARSEAFADAVSEKVAAATEFLRREMEETQRQKDNDRVVKKKNKEKRRLKEQLKEQSKKNDDMAAQRVKDLEEELRDKHNLDRLAQRNDLYREKLALDAAAQRAADQADFALQQKRFHLAEETLKLKKQEYDVEQRHFFERDCQMKSAQIAHNEKEVSLAERSAMIDENRKAADHQRKKENQRM